MGAGTHSTRVCSCVCLPGSCAGIAVDYMLNIQVGPVAVLALEHKSWWAASRRVLSYPGGANLTGQQLGLGSRFAGTAQASRTFLQSGHKQPAFVHYRA